MSCLYRLSVTRRMQLIEHSERRVTLSYNSPWTGERITREFWSPNGSVASYVREGDRQVCERLSSRGVTLLQGPSESLARIVRREYRSMMRHSYRTSE